MKIFPEGKRQYNLLCFGVDHITTLFQLNYELKSWSLICLQILNIQEILLALRKCVIINLAYSECVKDYQQTVDTMNVLLGNLENMFTWRPSIIF